jgi:hypothetical protein
MSSLADQIVKTLSPYLGALAARASLSMYLTRAGLEASDIQGQHLKQIADTLRPGLRVFLGPAKADALAQTISDLKP